MFYLEMYVNDTKIQTVSAVGNSTYQTGHCSSLNTYHLKKGDTMHARGAQLEATDDFRGIRMCVTKV